MCVILPVDHLSCTHTVAIWQHCIDAPRSRSKGGMGLCNRIRQHPRPIITRKLCYNCGGPRYFARRGGLSAKGQGNSETIEEGNEEECMVGGSGKEEEEETDSGYASDAIMEEEEDEFEMSPRERKPMVWGSRQKTGTPRYRSPNRKGSWKPSLKRELGGDSSPFPRRDSISSSVSEVSKFEDGIGAAPKRYWDEPASYRDSIVSAISEIEVERSASPRKNSTLLHPSSPSTDSLHLQYAIMGEIRRPHTPPSTTPPRTPSTLLHPSTPEPPLEVTSMTKMWELNQRAISPPLTPPMLSRPTLGHRKGSSLLHPSPPTSSNDTTKLARPIVQLQLPIRQPQISTKAVKSVITVEECEFEPVRRESVLHSCLSEVDSESDYGSDDQEDAEEDTAHAEDFYEQEADCITARAGMVSRASRVSFHGANMRVLQTT